MSVFLISQWVVFLAGILAEAALFVYTPKQLKALPYIVFMLMVLVFRFLRYSYAFLLTFSIPVAVLWLLLISGKAKKQQDLEREED